VTVCPYFLPLDPAIAEQYAEAGADAVSALLLPLGTDEVASALDALQPMLDRAAAS
jgi:thiazole synthase ThiGH ThiG subunit